jgi:hypothetical protein
VTVRSPALFAILAPVAAGLAGIAAVVWLTSPEPAPSGGVQDQGASEAAAAPAGASPIPSAAPVPDAPGPAGPADAAPSRAQSRGKATSAERRSLEREVLSGLTPELRARLAACAGEAGPGAENASTLRAQSILDLELATADGAIQIVDAPPHARSAEGDAIAFLACARDVLRGQTIPSRTARAGKRARMGLVLQSPPERSPSGAAGEAADDEASGPANRSE